MANENVGVAPPNVNTKVGQFRLIYGDSQFDELVPPEEGFGQYSELSDEEIETYLALSGDSVYRAMGTYAMTLSLRAAEESKLIEDFDLKVSTVQRSSDYRRVGQEWLKLAEMEDTQGGANDIFEVFPTVPNGGTIPELTVPIYGRQYTWGQIL